MPVKDPSVCLITTLRKYFEMVPVRQEDPCFYFRNKENELKSLTYEQLSSQLKEWLDKIGEDGSKFTLNCLRRGGMTHTFEMGIRPEFIKMMGDWASQCFFRYLDIALNNRLRAAVKFIK